MDIRKTKLSKITINSSLYKSVFIKDKKIHNLKVCFLLLNVTFN
jgi:hypothetical protein